MSVRKSRQSHPMPSDNRRDATATSQRSAIEYPSRRIHTATWTAGRITPSVGQLMRLIATDFYSLHRPAKCGLRVYLCQQGEAKGEPSPYEEVIRRLGQRHERAHLATFPSVTDLQAGSPEEREQRTQFAMKDRASLIYQGVFRASVTVEGQACDVVGEPDFLIADDGNYAIRDAKISRRITEADHPEILRQVELYGWLYQQTTGHAPARLDVFSGTGEVIAIPFDGGQRALAELAEIVRLKIATQEPFSPVGWTKCGSCVFHDRCWKRAEADRDVALVSGIDQGLALELATKGIHTVDQFIGAFTEDQLAALQRPWGKKTQRVGTKAGAILRMAQAYASGRETVLQAPAIPDHPNYVMFDLEGMPPQLDELDKIYLWGLQVFGTKPGAFSAATAGFGPDGDRDGWEAFLGEAAGVFKEHGDIPFVHWHHYERVRLDAYFARYGDPNGIAARVKANLLDLLPITQKSIALPLPSYSLKVVEKYVGFKRTQNEYGGDWAMAKFIEATETEDQKARAEIMDQILAYNREDLEATWAVLQWLKSKSP